MKLEYMEVISLAERMHRKFLEIIQLELDARGVRDIHNVQALILYNIGDAEMTVSELMWRGCYLGSNVSYNLKKLTETGYLTQTRSDHDKRVTMVRLSEKGRQLCEVLKNMNNRHIEALADARLKSQDLSNCKDTLRVVQQFWTQVSDVGALRLR